MNAPQGPAAPASGPNDDSDIPTFEELAADPEIAALLDFEPAPVRKRVNGWDAGAQRAFVMLLATTGSKGQAANAIGRNPAGIERILNRTDGESESFRAAVDAAMAVADRRNGRALAQGVADTAAHVARHSSSFRFAGAKNQAVGLPGQVLNEHGEWEDEESYYRRAEEAKDSIAMKLTRIRRLYLQDISPSPGKRAAFEILTELPVDWELARKGEPQPFEPWIKTNQRQPDMVLMAESGWTFGECGYGPDRKAEARAAIDEWRAERRLPAIRWEGEGDAVDDPEPSP